MIEWYLNDQDWGESAITGEYYQRGYESGR